MDSLPPDLAAAFAQRVAERDNPPPVVFSQEPAAIRARLEQWLLTAHQVRNVRARRRQTQALLALMQHPELDTLALGRASGPPALADRSAARLAVQLHRLGLTTWTYRGLYRYHRLTPATEDALLLVVQGPGGA
jgi:hypothetical protein